MNGLATTSQSDSFHQALAIIDAADLADSTKIKYRRVLECYLDEGHPLTDSAQLARFATSLSNSRRAQLKAAVRLWSDAMIVQAKSMASPDNIDTVNALSTASRRCKRPLRPKLPKARRSTRGYLKRRLRR